MKVSVLQSKDINTLSNLTSQLPPKIPAALKKQSVQINNTQPEEKKKQRENSYSVNELNLQSQQQQTSSSRNGQYPREQNQNQQLLTKQPSQKIKPGHKKRRSVSKSAKGRAASPVPSSSFTAGSYPEFINTIQQQNSSQGLTNTSLILKRNQLNTLRNIGNGNAKSELYLQIGQSQGGKGNIISSPLIQTTTTTTTSNQINHSKGDNSPYDGGVKNYPLKGNKTQSNFKISKNQSLVPRKKSLVSLEQSQTIINSNGIPESTYSNAPKPLSTIRIRSGKLLNQSQNGGLSPLQNNLGQNSSNRKLSNFSELNSLKNTQQRFANNNAVTSIFRVEEVGQENIQSIQYTQYNNNDAIINHPDYESDILVSPLNLQHQLQQTQRQNNTENTMIDTKWNQDTNQSRQKKARAASSKRKSTTFSTSAMNTTNTNMNNKKGMMSLLRGGGEGQDGQQKIETNCELSPQPAVLRLQLMTKKHNWRDLVRSYLTNTQYSEIHLSFYDIIVEIYDGLIFNNQMKCLRYLNLNFKENKYFNDESLLFLSAIKIPCLQHVKINLVSSQCSRIGANFLLFDFNYVPKVEIVVGDLSREKTLLYTHEQKFIEIDFSVQKTISRSEILSLSDSIFKSNHEHLKVNLNGVTDLTQEKLKILGRCVQEVKELSFSFQNCQMTQADLTSLINGLTFNNQRESLPISTQNKSQQFSHSTSSQQQQSQNSKLRHNKEDIDRISYDENDADILASKPISFWIKRGGNQNGQTAHVQECMNGQENTFIKKLLIDFRQNKEEIDKDYMKIFKMFKRADSLKLLIDAEKQVKQQYDGEVQAFCLGECLKDVYNCIDIAISDTHSIYYHNKHNKHIKINASNCGISPFQLIDIQKSLNQIEDIEDLEIDLSGNWQIGFSHLRKLFEKLSYFDRLKRIHLNIKSVFIYEVEFITLFFVLKRIPHVQIIHDFDTANLIQLDPSSLNLSFKGPFSRSKINNILDMQNFCDALDSCSLPEIRDIQMTFFFNYGLRGDSLLRLCHSLARFPRIERLDLNFNSCFLSFCDIVFFCNGLNNIDVSIKQMKLTFTNNDNVTANSLIKLAKTLQRFPLLDQLEIICETHELHLNPLNTNYAHIFNKFNTKTAVSRRHPRQKIQVQRVIPKIYSVLAHDIEQSYTTLDHKRQLKLHQNEYLTSLNVPLTSEEIIQAVEDGNNLPSVESSTSILVNPPIIPAQIQLEEIEPVKRNKVIRTVQLNWISLQFVESVTYSDYELMNLGYNLAQQETINHIITVPQKPIVEKIFNEMKTARLAGIFYSIIVTPEMVFNPTQIFCDLYL